MSSVDERERRLEAEQFVGRSRPRWRVTVSAVLANRLALAGLVVLAVAAAAAILGSVAAPYSPTAQDVLNRLQPPSLAHPFGTDDLGRDVLSRVIVGTRVAFLVGIVSVGLSLVAGTMLGLVAGFYRGFIDDGIMRFMDMLFAFPAILLAMAILAILGPGIASAMIAIAIVFTPIFARITRGSVLSVREEVYVRAARSLGASDWRLITKHVLPNVTAPLIVQTTVSLAFAILIEASLAYIGLGTQPPAPSWGVMLSRGQDFLAAGAWWMSFFPGMAILLVVAALNFVGDALRDALDPRQRSAIEARGQRA
jgi:peptide/nickel transport system permease protein